MTVDNQHQFNFNKASGLKIQIPKNSSIWYYYNLFFSDDIINLIVVETNRNAEQFLLSNRPSKSSQFLKWIPTNFEEIKKFIGLLLWMGLVELPSIESYWSKKQMYSNNVAGNVMPKNRFELLLQFWHFADNEKAPEGDKIYKIQDLIKKLVQNFQNVMEPGELMAVNETMIPFRGRLTFKQYIPRNAYEYGIKLFKICESNGFTYNIEVGKQQTDNKDSACKVVMNLCKPFLNEGRTIVTDNYYTSLTLANKLLKKKTHLVGTLRRDRVKLPKIFEKKLKAGEIVGKENLDGIIIVRWHDKRDIALLSTKHNFNMIDTGKKNKKNEIELKPKIIIDYNIAKMGINLSNKLSCYCSPVCKSVRWYHKVAIEVLLGISVANALIVYKKNNLQETNMSITKFREMLVDELLNLNQRVVTGNSFSLPKRPQKHKFEETMVKDARNRKIRKRCSHCYYVNASVLGSIKASANTKRVSTYCSTCNVYTCMECYNKIHVN